MLPALIPESVLSAAKTKDIKECVKRGWELQVRGRVREHLEYFAENYMEPGTYSAVIASSDKDYNVRFYTTREDYGNAIKKMALEIDYTKFKDTSLKFDWGVKYHDLLLKIWSASTSLAPAGGWYAPKTRANPRGFGAAKRFKRGNPRNRKAFAEYEEQFDGDGYFVSPSRKSSYHDLTDSELEEMWNKD